MRQHRGPKPFHKINMKKINLRTNVLSFSHCCESFFQPQTPGLWVSLSHGVIVQAFNHHFMTHVPLHLTNDRSNNRTQC